MRTSGVPKIPLAFGCRMRVPIAREGFLAASRFRSRIATRGDIAYGGVLVLTSFGARGTSVEDSFIGDLECGGQVTRTKVDRRAEVAERETARVDKRIAIARIYNFGNELWRDQSRFCSPSLGRIRDLVVKRDCERGRERDGGRDRFVNERERRAMRPDSRGFLRRELKLPISLILLLL